jgi:hypothetical protein
VLSALLQGQIGWFFEAAFRFLFSAALAMLQHSLRDFLLSIFFAFKQP